MTSNLQISIIIPTYNAGKTLSFALESILKQDFTDFEILVVDGLSTDDTLEVARRYRDQRIRIFSEKDDGIYDAMNKGIKLAGGKWIYFLGSDDKLYDKNVFNSLMPLLRNEKLEVIYGNVIWELSGKKYDGRFNKFKLLKKNICHQSMLTKKSVFNKIGKFELKYKALADWHFNMKWFNNKNIKHVYTDSIIAYYFDNGYSPNNPDMKFVEDWNDNTSKYFPEFIRFLYKCQIYCKVQLRNIKEKIQKNWSR